MPQTRAKFTKKKSKKKLKVKYKKRISTPARVNRKAGVIEVKKPAKRPKTRKARKGDGLSAKELEAKRSSLEKVSRPVAIDPFKRKQLKEQSKVFLDAQAMHKASPSVHYAPPEEELGNIKTGDSVKIGYSGELFWATVESIDGNKVKASIEHGLAHTDYHGMEEGNVLKFHKKNIFKIYKN